jgi:2'-5' RNA ligase
VRVFVGVWPPDDVVAELERAERPAQRQVRWTGPGQWHVTLVFLGEVDDGAGGPLADALSEVLAGADGAPGAPPTATVAATATIWHGSVLVAAVDGLDALAAAARRAVTGWSPHDDGRPFRGHLTLARARGGHRLPAALEGREFLAAPRRFAVDGVAVVRSDLRPDGARYENLAVVPAAGAAGNPP